MKSITDKAEVSIDFPDKAYMGSFGRESSFEVKVEPDEVLVQIVRAGEERRQVAVHLHYFLLADILMEMAGGLRKMDLDGAHSDTLRASAEALVKSLTTPASKSRKKLRSKSK